MKEQAAHSHGGLWVDILSAQWPLPSLWLA